MRMISNVIVSDSLENSSNPSEKQYIIATNEKINRNHAELFIAQSGLLGTPSEKRIRESIKELYK